MSKDKQPNPNFIPPASVRIPEQPAIPPVPLRASEYITISVAEYHFLTKCATWLEIIINCQSIHYSGLVEAIRKNLKEMQTSEAGADK